MCGRFQSVSSAEQLAEQFEVDAHATSGLPPRYNVAPSTDVYAVIERDGSRRLGTLRWGFVPPWAKQLKGARTPINARVETLADSRMFGPSFARRRCLIPADGFYEWQDRGEGRPKQPYHVGDPEGGPLAFAGVYSTWRDPEQHGEPLFSTAIVTTGAQGAMARIHTRCPLVLPRTLWRDWLTASPDDAPHLMDVVRTLQLPALRATPISRRVNNVRNEGPELLEPASPD